MSDRFLTKEEWAAQKPPMCWTTVKENWLPVHFELAQKWVLENSGDWVYCMDKTFIFGSESDKMIFELWLTQDITTMDHGSISAKTV